MLLTLTFVKKEQYGTSLFKYKLQNDNEVPGISRNNLLERGIGGEPLGTAYLVIYKDGSVNNSSIVQKALNKLGFYIEDIDVVGDIAKVIVKKQIQIKADLFNHRQKNLVYDVFFYIWLASRPAGKGEMEYLERDSQGRLTAYLEIYFPDKFTKLDEADHVPEKIKKKIEDAIHQPIKQRITSNKDEDSSKFYDRLRENFEPKIKTLGAKFEFDSMISHGMVFRIQMRAQ